MVSQLAMIFGLAKIGIELDRLLMTLKMDEKLVCALAMLLICLFRVGCLKSSDKGIMYVSCAGGVLHFYLSPFSRSRLMYSPGHPVGGIG